MSEGGRFETNSLAWINPRILKKLAAFLPIQLLRKSHSVHLDVRPRKVGRKQKAMGNGPMIVDCVEVAGTSEVGSSGPPLHDARWTVGPLGRSRRPFVDPECARRGTQIGPAAAAWWLAAGKCCNLTNIVKRLRCFVF